MSLFFLLIFTLPLCGLLIIIILVPFAAALEILQCSKEEKKCLSGGIVDHKNSRYSAIFQVHRNRTSVVVA